MVSDEGDLWFLCVYVSVLMSACTLTLVFLFVCLFSKEREKGDAVLVGLMGQGKSQ